MLQFTRRRTLETELESVAPRIRPIELPRFRPLQQAEVPSAPPATSPAAIQPDTGTEGI